MRNQNSEDWGLLKLSIALIQSRLNLGFGENVLNDTVMPRFYVFHHRPQAFLYLMLCFVSYNCCQQIILYVLKHAELVDNRCQELLFLKCSLCICGRLWSWCAVTLTRKVFKALGADVIHFYFYLQALCTLPSFPGKWLLVAHRNACTFVQI